MGLLADIRLAGQARRIVKAATPAQLPAATAGNVDQMLVTVEAALGTALGQPEHPTAAACAAVLLKHRERLEALFQQAMAEAKP